MATAEQGADIIYAIIREQFEPAIRNEVRRIQRVAIDNAKHYIDRELRDLALDFETRIGRIADKFKMQVSVDINVHLPEEWLDGQDPKAS